MTRYNNYNNDSQNNNPYQGLVKTAKPLHRARENLIDLDLHFIPKQREFVSRYADGQKFTMEELEQPLYIFLDIYKRYLGTGVYRLDQIDTKEITT